MGSEAGAPLWGPQGPPAGVGSKHDARPGRGCSWRRQRPGLGQGQGQGQEPPPHSAAHLLPQHLLTITYMAAGPRAFGLHCAAAPSPPPGPQPTSPRTPGVLASTVQPLALGALIVTLPAVPTGAHSRHCGRERSAGWPWEGAPRPGSRAEGRGSGPGASHQLQTGSCAKELPSLTEDGVRGVQEGAARIRNAQRRRDHITKSDTRRKKPPGSTSFMYRIRLGGLVVQEAGPHVFLDSLSRGRGCA